MSKSDGSAGRAFALFALILLIAGTIPLGGSGSSPDGGAIPPRDYTIEGKIVNGVVEIEGNDELVNFIDDIKAPGSGTEADPFVVDGWTFKVTYHIDYWALCMQDTDDHVVFIHCTFNESGTLYDVSDYWGAGINLISVENITFDFCIIEKSRGSGLEARGSSLTVAHSTIRNNGLDGVYLASCSGEMSNNTIAGNEDYGIETENYNDVVFENNNLIGNGFNVNKWISNSNKVNGKNLLFVEKEGTYSGIYGQVTVLCDNAIIKDMYLNDTTVGIDCNWHKIKVINCTFDGCSVGIRSGSECHIESSIFNNNEIGIDSKSMRVLFSCNNSLFENNTIGISAYDFFIISNNTFLRSSFRSIMLVKHEADLPNPKIAYNNTFIGDNGTSVYYFGYYGYNDQMMITNNSIHDATCGMMVSGNVMIWGNRIEDCSDTSIRFSDTYYQENNITLQNNTIIGTGLSDDGNSNNCLYGIHLDNTTTLNGLPVYWSYKEKSKIFDTTDYSEYILIGSYDIVLKNLTISTPRYSVIMINSKIVLIENSSIPSIMFREGCDKSSVLRCKLDYVSVWGSNPVIFQENDFKGKCGISVSFDGKVEAERNNFYCEQVLHTYYNGHIFDDNYYRDYYSKYGPNVTSNDGVHWDISYDSFYFIDKNPRVFPFGYTGSWDPVFITDRTPGEVDEGSNLTIDVEVWDVYALRHVYAEAYIDERLMTVNLSQGMGLNWSADLLVPINSTLIRYSIHSASLLGKWVNTTEKEVIVNDVTSPILFDISDNNGTTGDPFLFQLEAYDNRELSKVWIEYGWEGHSNIFLDMMGSDDFSEEIRIPDRIDPMSYSISALDVSGNYVTTPIRDIEIKDNDKPIATLPLIINTTIGDETYFDGNLSWDNIGIVKYLWTFKDGTSERELNGYQQTYIFEYPGFSTVTLKVEDAAGNTAEAVMQVNIEDVPTPPPPPPDPVFINAVLGKVRDNETGLPIEGVSISFILDKKSYSNITDIFGYTVFTLPERDEIVMVTLNLRKDGYYNLTYNTLLYTDGRFRDRSPAMIPIKDDVPPKPLIHEEEEDKKFEWWIPILIGIALLLIIGLGSWIYHRRGHLLYEE